MDNFITLSNRLLNRCPAAGIILCEQFVNDAWATLQAKREWTFRRRWGTFAPPTIYTDGAASTNSASGQPTLITGQNTAWTPDMIGRQIRIGGLLYPFYTIVGFLSPTALLIDQPWAGPDVAVQAYQILQCYYTVPSDFGYWYAITSIKDAYRLWTNITQGDLAMLDPQRTNFGQTYAVAFRDYVSQYGGTVGPIISIVQTGAAPISTTSTGYTYVANATYIIKVTTFGTTGTATFQWMRAGSTLGFSIDITTSDQAQDLADGVQVYWPDGVAYQNGDVFIINCQSQITQGAPRYELWPAPTFSGYLYPYLYIAKEYALTAQSPNLPPFIANRGEVLLEMALEKCAEYPGADGRHPNLYYNLNQAKWHQDKAAGMIDELMRNDNEVDDNLIDYQTYPFYPAPWLTGQWQQSHAPFLTS